MEQIKQEKSDDLIKSEIRPRANIVTLYLKSLHKFSVDKFCGFEFVMEKLLYLKHQRPRDI